MKLRAKLLLIAFIAILPLSVVLAEYHAMLRHHEVAVAEIEAHALPETVFLSDVFTRISNNHAMVFDLIASVNAGADEEEIYEKGRPLLAEFHAIADTLKGHQKEHLAAAEGAAIHPDHEAEMAELIKDFENYLPKVAQAVEMVTLDLALSDKYLIQANTLVRQVHSRLFSMIQDTHSAVGLALDDLRNETDRHHKIFLVIVAVAGMTSVVMLLLTSKVTSGLSRSLREIISVMSRVAEGDTAVGIPFRERKDEVGEIARATGVFLENLIDLRRAHAEKLREAAALRDSEERLRVMFESVAEGVITMDERGMVEGVNPAFEELFGIPSKDIVDRHLGAAISLESQGEYTAPASIEQCEIAGRRGDGTSIDVEMSMREFRLGERRLFIATMRDLSQRNQAAAEKDMLERELEQAARLQAVGQLAAGIAHEINTPIQFIGDNLRFLESAHAEVAAVLDPVRRLTEVLAQGGDSRQTMTEVCTAVEQADLDLFMTEFPMAARESLEGVERISRIVLAMKDFSHPGEQEKTLVDLNRAIETTLTVCASEWKRAAEIDLELAPDLRHIDCFPGDMNQVLLNLIINATHAIQDARPEGLGRIAISTREADGAVEIRISDDGCGMPESVRKEIFNPFFTTKPVGKGTGQGLAITWDIVVNRHQGTVDVESQEGRGTTFIVRLPIGIPAEACG